MAPYKFSMRSLSKTLAASVSLLIATSSPALAAGPKAAPIPPAPEFTSPDIKPTFADWLTASPMALAKKKLLTDPLLKPPFAAAPADSLKGMAAGIRAVQLDVPNRVKAAQYLGTVDCVTYPQAQDMLIATMQEDPSELVRYEAVMALRNMLTRGSCGAGSECECEACGSRKKIVKATEKHAKKGKKALVKEAKCHAKLAAFKANRQSKKEEDRYDCCRGCANEKVMKALAKVASEKDDQCCWVEPSERVRKAAEEALCLFKTYADGYSLPDLEPTPKTDEDKKGEAEATDEMESESDGKSEKESDSDEPVKAKPKADAETGIPNRQSIAPRVVKTQDVAPQVVADQTAKPLAIPMLKEQPQPPELPLVSGLRGRCIVALKARQVLPADSRFSSVFEERTYYFSSAEAKAAFDQNPRSYAPAYGGIDPVAWLSHRRMEEGQLLREFEGQFFFFSSKENWETFKGNPNRYVLRTGETNLRTVGSER